MAHHNWSYLRRALVVIMSFYRKRAISIDYFLKERSPVLDKIYFDSLCKLYSCLSKKLDAYYDQTPQHSMHFLKIKEESYYKY